MTAVLAAGTTVYFGFSAANTQPGNFVEAGYVGNRGNSENPYATGNPSIGQGEQVIYRIGETVMVQAEVAGTDAHKGGSGTVYKGIIVSVGTGWFGVNLYNGAGDTLATTQTFTSLVYGSEFAKGTGNMNESIDPSWETYSNAPIIMKDHYAINGSDTSAIGWVEISGADGGPGGYLWYMKAEAENKMRWEDKLEMAMVEAIPAQASAGNLPIGRGNAGVNGHSARGAA